MLVHKRPARASLRAGQSQATEGGPVARLVVIGGGAAGMSAASAARRTAPDLDVVVCESGGFAAYGMCGIPYFLGGIVPHAQNLLAYPPSEFRDHRGMDLRLHTRVGAIDASARQVYLTGEGGPGPLSYAKLVVATGADPVRPPVPGLDHPGVFTIRSLDEAIELRRLLDTGTVRRAIVVGAGYIGLETAEALVEAGVEVEVVEALPRVLATVDEPIADVVQAELERHVRLRLGARLDAVRRRPTGWAGTVPGASSRWSTAPKHLPTWWSSRPGCARPRTCSSGLARSTWPTGRSWSTPGCARRCRTCSRPATPSRCRTWCWAGRPGCRWDPRRTRPAGWRAPSPRVAPRRSPASSAPPWSRCSTSRWRAPGSGWPRPGPRAWTRWPPTWSPAPGRSTTRAARRCTSGWCTHPKVGCSAASWPGARAPRNASMCWPRRCTPGLPSPTWPRLTSATPRRTHRSTTRCWPPRSRP